MRWDYQTKGWNLKGHRGANLKQFWDWSIQGRRIGSALPWCVRNKVRNFSLSPLLSLESDTERSPSRPWHSKEYEKRAPVRNTTTWSDLIYLYHFAFRWPEGWLQSSKMALGRNGSKLVTTTSSKPSYHLGDWSTLIMTRSDWLWSVRLWQVAFEEAKLSNFLMLYCSKIATLQIFKCT
jgi:hypothetical protein